MGHLVRFASAVERIFSPRASLTAESAAELEAFISGQLGPISKAGITVTTASAQQLSAVYSCVRVLSETIAHLPLVLYARDGKKREAAVDHPVYRLLKSRPNEWQTSFEWRELKVRDLNLRGNAYSLIVRGFGDRIQELIRLHPDQVRPKQDARSLAISYEYTRRDGRRIELARRDVLHVRGMGDDGLVGLSPIKAQRETLGGALATQEHGNRFWANGAKPGSVATLEEGKDMSDPARIALREDLERMYAGSANAYKTAVLPKGVKLDPLQVTNEDAQFLGSRKFQRTEIAGIYRVPPHKIGDLDKATFSNIEHQGLEFATDSITPWAVRFEQAIDRDLLDNDSGLFVKFNLAALLRGDFKSRQIGLQTQRRNGVINANEWRIIEDMNPRDDDGGEEYIVERNMGPQDGADATDGTDNKDDQP